MKLRLEEHQPSHAQVPALLAAVPAARGGANVDALAHPAQDAEDLAAAGYSRGGWHASPGDPRVHLTSVPPGSGQAQHQYLDPGDPVRMLGRAAIGLTLGGPFGG